MNERTERRLQFMTEMPKICVPIVGKTESEIVRAGKELSGSAADLIEWRADYFEHLFEPDKLLETLKKLRKALGKKPLLFTIRTAGEGGETAISFAKYSDILCQVGQAKLADYIDVETFWGYRTEEGDLEKNTPEQIAAELCHEPVRCLVQELQTEDQAQVIGSYHDFDKTPSDMEMYNRLLAMKAMGVAIPKMAVMPQNREDVMRLMQVTMRVKERLGNGPVITMSMGSLGAVSRVAGALYGSDVTFGCAGKASAPGQIELDRLQEMLKTLAIKEG